MTVLFFVGLDSEKNCYPPETSHEMGAFLDIANQLWDAYNKNPDVTYVGLANISSPKADIVILTERGIGVVELKHHFGQITINNEGKWQADEIIITAGHNYKNPHDQVQT